MDVLASSTGNFIKVRVDQFDRLAQYVFHGTIPRLGYEHTRRDSLPCRRPHAQPNDSSLQKSLKFVVNNY
jgi:hypothetical protein